METMSRADACAFSTDTLLHLATDEGIHLPASGCDWTSVDLSLGGQVGQALASREKDPASWDFVEGVVPSLTQVDRPTYSLARTRARVHVVLSAGHGRCYFIRTFSGWRAQSCSTWQS